MPGRLDPEREHLRIRCGSVRPGEGFDAGLQEFARPRLAVAEHRAEIAEALRLTGGRRGEIVARDRDGEVRAQAQLVPVRIAGEVHALADVLAGEVEERLRRLQDRRRNPHIARALERGEKRLGPRIGRSARREDWCARHGAVAKRSVKACGGRDLARSGGEFDGKAGKR
jgi:hypothetical protein